MTPQTSNAVIEQALEARALNVEQDRLIANDTEHIDSIAEHAGRLLRLTQGEARAHAAEIIRLAAKLDRSNDQEGECERAIPPLLEPSWTVKRAAAELRDPLAVLTNPMIRGARRERSLAMVAGVISECPLDVLRSASLGHELRVAKTTVLHALLDEAEARS